MKAYQFIGIITLILALYPVSTRAEANCTEPYYSQCNAGCSNSSCRVQCRNAFCNNPHSPQGSLNPAPPQHLSFPGGYPGIWGFYGPFFPSYDNGYLTSLIEQARNDLRTAQEFVRQAQQIGDPLLVALGQAAVQQSQQRIQQLSSLYGYAYNNLLLASGYGFGGYGFGQPYGQY